MTSKTFVKNPQLEQTAATLAYALGLPTRCVRRAVEKRGTRLIKDTDKVFQLVSRNGKREQTLYNAREVAKQIGADLGETEENLVKPRGLKTTYGTYKVTLINEFEFDKEKPNEK